MPPVNVIDPSGAIFSLPSEQLDAAISQGYREATPDQIAHYDRVKEAGGTMGQAQAGFGTLADQLTLGAFKPALKHFSPERAEQLEIAQEANPGVTTAANVAGFAGTLANPFVAAAMKPAAKVGEMITGATPTIAKTIAAKTAEGVTAGATLGTPKALAEASGGDFEEAAETLLASGMYGGAFGFLIGGAQGVAQKTGPAYAKIKEYVSGRAEEAVRNQKTKALGAIQSDVAKLTPEQVDDTINFAEQNGMFEVFKTKGGRLEKAKQFAETAGKAKAKAIDDMTEAGLIVDTAPMFSKGNEIITEKGKFEKLGKPYVKAVNDITDDINALGPLTPKTADELKMTLGPEGWDAYGKPIETPKGYVAREMYSTIKQTIIETAEEAVETSPLAQSFVDASRAYNLSENLERWALRAVNRGANQGLKLSDLGSAAVGGQLGGVRGMLTGWILNNARHEFGNMAAVKALEGTLKAGQSVSEFIGDWGKKALNPKVTKAAKIGSINAVRELTGEDDESKATEQVVNNLSQFSNNPHMAVDILSQSVPELSQADPRVASALHQKAIILSQALLAAAPKKTLATSPFETDPGYTSADIRDFNKKIAIAMNPLSAMKDLAAGRLDPDSMNLIRKVYPNLYSQMQRAVIDDATANKRTYSYGQKLNLSLFLGSEVDTIGQPQNIKTFQDNFAKKEQQPNKSRRKPTAGSNSETVSQRIEGR